MQRRNQARLRQFVSVLAALSIGLMAGRVYASSGAASAVDLSQYEETGETRMCLTYSQLSSFVPLDNRLFFFVEGDQFYLNKTLSDCRAAANPEVRIKFIIKTGKICRNTRVHVYKKTGTAAYGSCALGQFRKLRLKPKDIPPATQ